MNQSIAMLCVAAATSIAAPAFAQPCPDKSINYWQVNVGTAEMDAFMKEKIKLYFDGAKRLGLGK